MSDSQDTDIVDQDAVPATGDAGSHTFLLIEIDGGRYAIWLKELVEIIVMPTVVRMPLGPRPLSGLANLRGNVLPVVDLARALGCETLDDHESRLVVVCRTPELVGLSIQHVDQIVSAVDADIEPVGPEAAPEGDVPRFIEGLLRVPRSDNRYMILSVENLMDYYAYKAPPGARAPNVSAPAPPSRSSNKEIDTATFLVLRSGTDLVAMPVLQVGKILPCPDDLVMLPALNGENARFATIDGQSIPAADLRTIMSHGQADPSCQRQLMVFHEGQSSDANHFGLIIDDVLEVITVPTDDIRPSSEVAGTRGEDRLIDGVINREEAGDIVLIMSVSELTEFYTDMRPPAAPLSRIDQGESTMENTSPETGADTVQAVIFMLGKEEYGVPITDVQEIICLPEQMTSVPQSPDWFEGIVNLRGTILPVVELRVRVGMERLHDVNLRQALVLCSGQSQTGFIVDQIVDVITLPESAFRPALEDLSDAGVPIKHIVNVESEERVIMMLDVELVMGRVGDAQNRAAVA